MSRGTWLQQLVTIQGKGYKAFQEGKDRSDCPYRGGYHNQNGPGGSLQRQRRQAWLQGFQQAILDDVKENQ
jgi:ribosome modulation factor